MAKQMVEFLVEEFVTAAREQGQDWEKLYDDLQPFCRFVQDYLKMYPPTQLSHADGRIQLSNLKVFSLGLPFEQQQGSMQPSTYVPASGQETLAEMRRAGDPFSQALAALPEAAPTWGAAAGGRPAIPPGSVDFTAPQPVQDVRTLPQLRFDQR